MDIADDRRRTPEEHLWRKVLIQAAMDADSHMATPDAEAMKGWARAWLMGGRDDFREVCVMAGMDPQHARDKFCAYFTRRKGERPHTQAPATVAGQYSFELSGAENMAKKKTSTEAVVRSAERPEKETTVTISGDGIEPVTLTDSQLKKVAARFEKKDRAARHGAGHNSLPGGGKEALKSYIERIERLEEEKATLGVDIREVFAEAKANGYDTKIMRKVIALRKIDATERDAQQEILELYMANLGMLPLFAAADAAKDAAA